jgi:hypothetical protein
MKMQIQELKQPWMTLEAKFTTSTVDELYREIGANHALNGKKVSAVARRQDCDDILFLFEGEAGCAVVHLTYRGKIEPDPRWPSTEIFVSLEAWRLQRMIPDHEEFVG